MRTQFASPLAACPFRVVTVLQSLQDSNGTLELAEWLNFSRRLALRGEAAAKRMVERLTAIVKKELDLIAADAAAGRGPPRDAGGSERAPAADSRPAPAGAKP